MKHKRTSTAFFAVLILVIVATGIPAATPAHAAGAPTLHTGTGLSSGNTYAAASVACPPQRYLHGGGARVINGGGEVAVSELVPDLTTHTLTAVATAVNGAGPAQFAVEVHAICASYTANLTRVEVRSPFNQLPVRSATAVCPAGTSVYGHGYEIHGPNLGQVLVSEIEPAAGLNSVTVTAAANGGWAGWWELAAWAICGDPTPGMSRVEVLTQTGLAQTPCPGASRVYSVGAEVPGGAGDVVLQGFGPTNALLTAAAAQAGGYGGFVGAWGLQLYAVCA